MVRINLRQRVKLSNKRRKVIILDSKNLSVGRMLFKANIGIAERDELNADKFTFLVLEKRVLHESIDARLLAKERLQASLDACNALFGFDEVVFDAGNGYLLSDHFLLKG